MRDNISLSCGNGGRENNALIRDVFYEAFGNEILAKSEDAAPISADTVVSTDSFTVDPLFFPGGDIGKLSICGSCNDVAMMGAWPEFITTAFIIEEGFLLRDLQTITASMQQQLRINGTKVISGDTKVVPKGSVDKLFINTTAIGRRRIGGISAHNINAGDAIIISRDIGAHGAAIFAAREEIDLQSSLQSDCASLYPAVEALLEAGIKPKAMRDATRGGVAAVLNEWALASGVRIDLNEADVPVSDAVGGICEILGFDALNLANEGTFVLAVEQKQAETVLQILRQSPQSTNAALAGYAQNGSGVVLHSAFGTQKPLDMPSGEILPRIC